MYFVDRIAHDLRASGRTTAFLMRLLPMLPAAPVDLLTRRPVIETVAYPSATGPVSATLYRPPGAGPHPGIVVCLGVVPIGVEHPQIARLGEAFARAGAATLLYWSTAMRDLRLVADDVEGIARAYEWLIGRPDIDAKRSGLLGTCVGGSFALMGAAHEAIRDRVAFVTAFAPYSSIRTFVRDIASGSVDGGTAWHVDQLTRRVFVRSLLGLLPSADVSALQALDDPRSVPPTVLSADGRAVRTLLASPSSQEAAVALDALSDGVRGALESISPLAYVDRLRAPLICIAHDRDDHVIPVGESRRLYAALGARAGVHYTEFMFFEHADPTKRRRSPLRLILELLKFHGYARPAFDAMTA